VGQKIYINLPVESLDISKDFYSRLGYSFNLLYTNEVAACMVVSDDIHVMLLTKPFFATFTQKEIADTHTSAQVMICLGKDSRKDVDVLVDKAIAAGAKIERPTNDHDFMYERSFNDPDGNIWEVMWLDEVAYKKMMM
jgi:predicted lactoylglutathione lyase